MTVAVVVRTEPRVDRRDQPRELKGEEELVGWRRKETYGPVGAEGVVGVSTTGGGETAGEVGAGDGVEEGGEGEGRETIGGGEISSRD